MIIKNKNEKEKKEKNYQEKERKYSNTSSKLERNFSVKTNSTAQASDNSFIKGDSESDDVDADCPFNSKFINFEASKLNDNDIPVQDHLDTCLHYWQDIIYQNGFNKA